MFLMKNLTRKGWLIKSIAQRMILHPVFVFILDQDNLNIILCILISPWLLQMHIILISYTSSLKYQLVPW